MIEQRGKRDPADGVAKDRRDEKAAEVGAPRGFAGQHREERLDRFGDVRETAERDDISQQRDDQQALRLGGR